MERLPAVTALMAWVLDEWERSIVAARDEGHSLRAIAAVAGCSNPHVLDVTRRRAAMRAA